jgi:hypothetical protein
VVRTLARKHEDFWTNMYMSMKARMGASRELLENIEVGNGLRECLKGLGKHLAFLPCQSMWFWTQNRGVFEM